LFETKPEMCSIFDNFPNSVNYLTWPDPGSQYLQCEKENLTY